MALVACQFFVRVNAEPLDIARITCSYDSRVNLIGLESELIAAIPPSWICLHEPLNARKHIRLKRQTEVIV